MEPRDAMENDKTGEIAQAQFRKVMGSFPTGITVITAESRGEIRGMTANAFMSGSLHPPLCIVSVAKRARMHVHLVEAGHFGVSILGQGQEHHSAHFSGRPVAGFTPAFMRLGQTPVLRDASATIAADTVARHDCGDHSIFVGHVVHLQAHGRVPLVVHDGRYASLKYLQEAPPEPVADFW
jgi:flavin reductase (DIM6/NTAB) family NADH-FMN oxidoreductase RutF